jgi:hypothetical protein
MKLSLEDWGRFGRYMMLASGVALICLAIPQEETRITLFLRVWSGLFGLYCIYLGIVE